MSPRSRFQRVILLTALAYGGLALLVIALTIRVGGVALVWPATGLVVAVMATLRPRRWHAVLLAVFATSAAATLVMRQSMIAAIGFSIANVLEMIVVATLLHRLIAHRNMLYDAGSVLRFAFVGGLVAPLLTAPVAAVTAWAAFGMAPVRTLVDWSLAHGVGMLVMAPLALMAVIPKPNRGRRRPGTRALAKFAAPILAVAVTSVAVFAQDQAPLLFLPLLPVMIATVRLGKLGSAMALLAVVVPGVLFTVAGHGPIHLIGGGSAFSLQFLQLYLATVFLISLPTAALLTRQRALADQLREREAALRLLSDHSSDVLLSLDVAGFVRIASPSVRALAGCSPDALVGRNAIELVAAKHRGSARRAHLKALAAPDTNVTVEYQAWRQDCSSAWYETITRAVSDGDGGVSGVVCAIRDVSHRKVVERQLRQAADTDALTGLPNRRPFLAALEKVVMRAGREPATMVMLDLDHFKRINDEHGHAAGDAALVTIAELFGRELRGRDVAARLGGEEFAILFRGIELSVAEATCERLRLAIARQPILAQGAPLFHVTASLGLAEITPGLGAQSILKIADRALYAAKAAGRNRLSVAA